MRAITIIIKIIITIIFVTSTIFVHAQTQQQNYNSGLLFVALFSDGLAQVAYDVNVIDIGEIQTMVLLIGKNVSRINVIDYTGNVVDFIEEENKQPRKSIIINSPDNQGIRITYQTSDFAHAMNKGWVFSLNSPIPFTLKLPINSTIIDWNVPPTSLELLGGQHLLSFNSGNVTVSYIIEENA
jgi:hypothetical protein